MKFWALIGISVVAASSHAVLIDDFTTGSYNSGYFSTGTVSAWTPASSVGGSRFTNASITANPLGNDMRVRVQTPFATFQVGTESQVDAILSIGYGFASSSTTPASNPLNLNLTLEPVLAVKFAANDVTLPSQATIYTNGGANTFTVSLNVAGGIVPSSPQTVLFDFSSVAASLADVDAIRFDFDAAPGGDFSLNSVQAVPEPMTLAILGVGAASLVRRRKK